MARLGIAAAGAVVGGVVGGPTGASIGWLAGSLLGAMLFPGEPTQGPRLNDLNVTTSAYGTVIPRGYGVIREGGNMIWSSSIIEDKDSNAAGKGGPKVIEYSYRCSFAISFGVGPAVDVLRIWADSKLIFDKHAATDTKQAAGLSFRFYPGNETQEPDSLIESYVGVGETPAYRGQCYIVFDNLPLTDFGNRIPVISAEIAYTTVTENDTVLEGTPLAGGALTSFNTSFFAVDWERQYAYAADESPFLDPTLTGIRRINLQTMLEDRQILSVDALDQTSFGHGDAVFRFPACVLPSGRILTQIETSTGTNAEPFVVLDATTLHEVARFGTPGSNLDFQVDGWGLAKSAAPVPVYGEEGLQDFAIVRSTNGSFGILYAAARGLLSGPGALADVWNSDEFLDMEVINSVRSVCGGVPKGGAGTAYAITGNGYTLASSDSIKLWRLKIPAAPPPEDSFLLALTSAVSPRVGVMFAMAQSITGSATRDVLTFTPAALLPGETSLRNAGLGMVYDKVDDCVIFHAQKASDLTHWLIKVRVSSGAIVWRTEVGAAPNDGSTWAQGRIEGGTFGFFSGSADGTQVDTRTGDVLVNEFTFPVGVATGAFGAYDARTESWVGLTASSATVWGKWYFRRVSGEPAALSDIITDICGVVKLTPSDIDVTDLVDDQVPGYVIGRQASGRQGIEPLSLAYMFDAVESDHIVKFVQRGGAVARTIQEDELYATDRGSGDFFTEIRQQEAELPVVFNVVYMNPDKDYMSASHNWKRILLPTPTVGNDNNAALEFPGALLANFARQLAETSLVTIWIERISFATGYAWTHIDLDPTDVVAVALQSETLPRLRISRTTVGDSLSIEANLLMEEEDQYTSTATADGGSAPGQEVPTTLATKLFVLDVPLLRDSDEPSSRSSIVMYYMMGGYGSTGWRSAMLFKSITGADYEQQGRITNEMTWGSTVNALGDPVSVFATDEINTLTVFMQTTDTALESVTQLEMLNGANPAALLKANGEIELIQYRDVTANADGSYTLSGLIRGRRGTDTMAYNHTAGEVFLLLVGVDIGKFALTLGELNATRYYKGVGAGQFFEDAPLVVEASEGRALMPYAPVLATATLVGGNDIDLAWVRRTRVGGEITLFDFGGDVPINEDTEAYEVDIFDTPGGTVVRTITGLTSPAATYTSAQQTTDGFSPPLTSLTVAIYQISAQVGRGFARETTLVVE